MRIARSTALALLVCAAACATGRKDLGEVRVTSTPPLLPNQLIQDFTYRVEEGRIYMTSPGNATVFDIAEEPGGCLRGTVQNSRNLREVCRVPPTQGDPADVPRWKSQDSTLTFTAALSPDKSRVIVNAGLMRGEFVLGEGPAADELRKRPELLGAAFAFGYVPNASGAAASGDTRDYVFRVASAK
jgi:hypothetical protein